jgi:hypothetical protein
VTIRPEDIELTDGPWHDYDRECPICGREDCNDYPDCEEEETVDI